MSELNTTAANAESHVSEINPRQADLKRRIVGIMAEASAEADEVRAAKEAMHSARQDALEEIVVGYRALVAIADLVGLGGGRSNMNYRKTLDTVACDDLADLLTVVHRSIGKPLEETGFAESLTCRVGAQS